MAGVDIKKDDTVRVMTGKSRGHTGRVIRVLPREGRVLVEGGNLAKKHQRTTGRRGKDSTQQLQQGGIIDSEMPLNISNVQIVCKTCGQPTRVGHHVDAGGTKVRICRKCGSEL